MSTCLRRVDVVVPIDGTGAAIAYSPQILGHVKAIGYKKGNVNAATTAAITTKNSPIAALDSYDVNAGDAIRYVRAAVVGSAAGDNKWCEFIVDDQIEIAVVGGAASKTFTVQIYYSN